MNRKHWVVLAMLGTGFTGTAMAQSSVTLYGIVDQSVRFTTNSNAQNGNQVQLTNGAITNSRWGLKGSEDLGGGLSAIFDLESGFEPENGQLDSGALFGRYAYVGISSPYGTLTMGRQGTEAFNFTGDFDPLTVANYADNSWPFFMTIGRISNAISYAGLFDGLHIGVTGTLGGQAGSFSTGSSISMRMSYDMGPLSFGGTYQDVRDLKNNSQRMWGAAAKYRFASVTAFVGYLGGSDATGNVDAALNDPSRTVATGDFAQNRRRDAMFYGGVQWQFTPALALYSGVYYDKMGNVNGFAGNSGSRITGAGILEYSLSKSTQVYTAADFNRVTGGAYTELPGRNNQLGLSVGMRHSF